MKDLESYPKESLLKIYVNQSFYFAVFSWNLLLESMQPLLLAVKAGVYGFALAGFQRDFGRGSWG